MKSLYQKYLDCGGRVTTDSRAIKGGEMFIALKGENFDGNAYALKALENGAACAVVNTSSEAALSGDERIVAVEDTFVTLKDLARYHRENVFGADKHLTVIGLTGTNGKTTTKNLINAVLSKKYVVTATEGNLNNDIGVPLSLLKITPETELAVIEMGANHPDDIAHLVDVSEPDFGLITNVGRAHLLGFGSFEGVKKAKGQLYDWVSDHQGTLFVNVDDPDLREMAAARQGVSIIPYGVAYNSVSVLPASPEEPFLRIQIGDTLVRTHLVGAYNATNVLAALCIGSHFEVPFEEAVAAIEAYIPANSRSQMKHTERNLLILDAYNANPSSMGAALDNFSQVESGSKIALLGDMRELGEESVREHVAIVKRIGESDFKARLVGEEFRKALEETGGCANVLGWYPDSASLCKYLTENQLSDAVVLVKGSRGIEMEKVIPAL